MSQGTRPKWVVPVVVGFFAVCFLMFFLVASTMLASEEAANSGMGGDWERLGKAQAKGTGGWPDVQALMLSSEPYVAAEALSSLLSPPEDEAHDLAFAQLPSVRKATRDQIRNYSFSPEGYSAAANRVKDRDPGTMEGALLFLKLSQYRDQPEAGRDAIFSTLVSAIPDYEDDEADELAFTIGLFRPRSLAPLLDMLAHEKPRARQTALDALGRLGMRSALPDVQKLLSDPDPAVREAAKEAEKKLSAASPP